jgi:hypothetical protein
MQENEESNEGLRGGGYAPTLITHRDPKTWAFRDPKTLAFRDPKTWVFRDPKTLAFRDTVTWTMRDREKLSNLCEKFGHLRVRPESLWPESNDRDLITGTGIKSPVFTARIHVRTLPLRGGSQLMHDLDTFGPPLSAVKSSQKKDSNDYVILGGRLFPVTRGRKNSRRTELAGEGTHVVNTLAREWRICIECGR